MAAVDAAEFPIGMVAVALAAGRVSAVVGAVAAVHDDTDAVVVVAAAVHDNTDAVVVAAVAVHADTDIADEVGNTAEDWARGTTT